jgi:hypothetical protein
MLWLQTGAEIGWIRPTVRRGRRRGDRARLDGRCVVQGPVTDIGLVYAALDVFLLTSKFEGLPNSKLNRPGFRSSRPNIEAFGRR